MEQGFFSVIGKLRPCKDVECFNNIRRQSVVFFVLVNLSSISFNWFFDGLNSFFAREKIN
jgi:hypothetical protein